MADISSIVSNGLRAKDDPEKLALQGMVENFDSYLKRVGFRSRTSSQRNGIKSDITGDNIWVNCSFLNLGRPFGNQAINVYKEHSGAVVFELGQRYKRNDYWRFDAERTLLEVSPDHSIYNIEDLESILAQIVLHVATQKQNVETILNSKKGKPALSLIEQPYDPYNMVENIVSTIKDMSGVELPVLHHSEVKGFWASLFSGTAKEEPELLPPPDVKQAETIETKRSHTDIAADFKAAANDIQFKNAALQELADQVVDVAEKASAINTQDNKIGSVYISPLAKTNLRKTFLEMDMITPIIANVKAGDQERALSTLSTRFQMALEELGSARIQAATTELDIILSLREKSLDLN